MILFMIGCSGGNSTAGNSGDGQENPGSGQEDPGENMVVGQALLGPLAGANVDVFSRDDASSSPIYSTTTTDASTIAETGIFYIPIDILDDSTLYTIFITGGTDIDADDDGAVDTSATANNGLLHLIATGAQLKSGDFNVTILTDIVYQKVSYRLYAGYSDEVIRNDIDLFSKILLAEDSNGDGEKDLNDVLIWDPVSGKDKVNKEWSFFEACSSKIREDLDYSEELKEIQRYPALNVLSMPGSASDIEIDGEYAFVADFGTVSSSSGLRILDISDPVDANLVGSVDTPERVSRIALSENYAIVTGSDGLYIIDISSVTTPVIVGSLELSDSPGDVAVSGGYAYVPCSFADLIIIVDIDDPAAPFVVNTVVGPPVVNDISIRGEYIFFASGADGLEIFSIENPTLPIPVGAVDTPGYAFGVVVSDDRAYVADDLEGLQVVDIRDMGNPAIIANVQTPGSAENVTMSNDYIYLTDALYTHGGYSDEFYLHVIDIRDSTAPFIADELFPVSGRLSISGNYIYAAGGDICIIDVSDLAEPALIANNNSRKYVYAACSYEGIAVYNAIPTK